MKNPRRIVWMAVVVAWCFDFLFWQKPPGISFAIFTIIALGTGLVLSRLETVQPDRRALWLLIPILVLASGTFIRREPFTTFLNYTFTLGIMWLFAHTYVGGRWYQYSWSDYFVAFLYLFNSIFVKPIEAFKPAEHSVDEQNKVERKSPSQWKQSLPYLRGLLIALPIVAIFASLFAAADPIFANYLEEFVEIFRLERLPEYIFRSVYILVFGYALTGIYLHAYTSRKDKVLVGEEKPWLPSFLGFTETIIVLGSVVILFSLFVGIQFRYFFGGQSNINIDGFTYAEYARRGFGELVVVSFFSLLLFLGLSAFSRRETRKQRNVFSALGIGLVTLLVVILFSAFQRLLLYEQAYGFTRLRTYSHVFMIWLGCLLAAVVILEVLRKQRAFALAGFLTAVGFIFSLNLLNVDGLIVRQNLKLAISSGNQEMDQENENTNQALDTFYLNALSTDSTPALIRAHQNQQLSDRERDQLAAVLACQIIEVSERRSKQTWQSYHLADERAWQLLTTHRDDFRAAKVYQHTGSWWVMVDEERRPCRPGAFGFD